MKMFFKFEIEEDHMQNEMNEIFSGIEEMKKQGLAFPKETIQQLLAQQHQLQQAAMMAGGAPPGMVPGAGGSAADVAMMKKFAPTGIY